MPDENDRDAELLADAQQGDPKAFGHLYERYAPAVFRFAYAHLSDRQDAEDLTEEVFLRAWCSLPRFREQGIPFIAYLFRIARNALIDQYRRNLNGRASCLGNEELIGGVQRDPGDALAEKMESHELRSRLKDLRQDYQTVLSLRFLSNLSPDETAVVMEKSPGAVRVLQHRALRALRKLLVNS